MQTLSKGLLVLARACRAGVKETVALTTRRSRDILGELDTLVDIGAFAEKEVIQ
jgi:hypothetical protein